MPARGILHLHSASPALCPHIESTVARVIGAPAAMQWAGQPAAPGLLRTEFSFDAEPGAAAAITSALAGWRQQLRFDVTEEQSPGCDGARYSYTPGLGIFAAVKGANGDVLVPEERLRAVLRRPWTADGLAAELGRLLGQPWDDELEPFRRAADAAPARCLTAAG